MKRFSYSFLSNKLHYYLLFLLIAFLAFENIAFIILLLPYFIFLHKRVNVFLVIISLLVITTSIVRINVVNIPIDIKDYAKVVNKQENRYTIKHKTKNYHMTSYQEIEIGSTIFIDGKIEKYQKKTRPGGFNYYNYYLSNSVYGKVVGVKISNIKPPLIKSLKALISEKLSRLPSPLREYSFLFILNENIFKEDERTEMVGNKLFYLLGYNNVYLYFLFYLFKKMCYFCNINKNTRKLIEVFFLVALMVTIPSSFFLRNLTLYGLYYVNEKLRFKLTRLDLLTIAIFILILLNPFVIYQSSFIIFFLINVFILLINEKSHFKNSFFSQLIIFPFFRSVNLLNPVLMIVTIGVGVLSFSVTILSLVITPLTLFASSYFEMFEIVFSFLNKIDVSINIAEFSLVTMIIYFSLFAGVFIVKTKVKKILVTSIFVMLCVGVNFKSRFSSENNLYFLDVGQGDTTIIERKFENTIIVIDAFKYVIDFMNSKNFTKIDHLFITHSDLDHNKEVLELLKNKQVKNVYLNYYDETNYNFRAQHIKDGDEIICGDLVFKVLSPSRDYENVNDNSLVLKAKIDQKIFLFAGDIEQKPELDLVIAADLKSDVVKIPHHGSKTSSHYEFLESINPEIAIISVGKNNFGHPSAEVLSDLKRLGIMIYQTNISGTIQYTSTTSSYHWKFWLPFT